MNITQAAATATQILAEADFGNLPMPVYVSISETDKTGYLSFQMATFDRVEEWTRFVSGETYHYHEADSTDSDGKTRKIGFGKITFHVEDPDHGTAHVEVYHNEPIIEPYLDQPTLDETA